MATAGPTLYLNSQQVLTGVSLECSKTPAKAKLDKVETGLYKEVRHKPEIGLCLGREVGNSSPTLTISDDQALKQQTPRQVDLNFEALAKKFQERHERHLEVVAEERCVSFVVLGVACERYAPPPS